MPTISVMLLTRNAGPEFERTLKGIRAQQIEANVEIVAVDSGSTDTTLCLLEQYADKVVQIPVQEFAFGRTRDYGFSLCSGDILTTISQDCIPVRDDWLRKLIAPLDDPAVGAVGGDSFSDPDQPLFSWYRVHRFYFTREFENYIQRHGREACLLSFHCAAVRRSVWEEIRVGETPMSEDKLFSSKLVKRGFRIAFVQDVGLLHNHDFDFRSLAKRCLNEGMGMRYCGVPYTLMDTLKDVASPRLIRAFWREVRQGRHRKAAELFYPLTRPFCLYYGNRFLSHYVR